MVRVIANLRSVWVRRCIGAGLFAALAFLAVPPPRAADRHEPGRAVYNARCYVCHGYSGDARTLAARFLDPPPRNFHSLAPDAPPRRAMIETVTRGRPGTAMQAFAGVLAPGEIESVVDFIRSEFMEQHRATARYHTAANGWPDHERYAAAFPFATGETPLDAPWETLDEGQRAGRRLFFTGCISCHDRSRVMEGAVGWERQALSYPRFQFRPGDHQRALDATTGATPFARHDIPPRIARLTAQERQGETLFQANCAFCHAADGTGRNWIGRFLQPHPRDLTDPAAMAGRTRDGLRRAIRDGLPGTSMPAWRAVLDERQIDAAIAYIARAFHPVAGEPSAAEHSRPAITRP